MKKIIAIAIALMLTLGILLSLGIVAFASDTTNEGLPETVNNLGRFPVNAGDIGLDYYAIWNAFPEEIERSYENGIYYVTDKGFTNASFWSYLDYKTYQFTLVDGKWQCEFTEELNQAGGLIYMYSGDWEVLYRGGTKEAVCLEGENELGVYYLIEIMSHLFRIYSIHYIGLDTLVGDAYYKFNGELDYISVHYYYGDEDITVYFNSQRETTMVYDGTNYMLPDGKWYSGPSAEYETCEPAEKFAGMRFEEVAALAPCLIYCGDHQPSNYPCDIGQLCTVCFELLEVPSDHDYEVSHIDPDCENKGCTLYACRNCDDSYTKNELDALGHTYEAVVIDPTCEYGGCITHTCTVCGNSYNTDETEALGHDFKDGECTVCGETDPDSVPKEPTASEPEQNWLVKLIYVIINFFKKLFGII